MTEAQDSQNSQKSYRLKAGTILDGRYELGKLLGAGGFAAIYAARQLTIERKVAIKVLHPPVHHKDPTRYRKRFLREARIAAQVQHPNVVTIHEYGVTDDDQAFIVMEMLTGHDLREELRHNGPLSAERGLRVALECLSGLAQAHKKDIVHRDLKPSNIFLHAIGTRDESVRIVDFGIARMRQEKEGLTRTGHTLGTPRYYAPEYLSDQTVTPALDVYQMGLILIEIFTGQKAVPLDDPYACAMRHLTGDLEIPKALLISPLGKVLQGALMRDHKRRYAHAGVFYDALAKLNPADLQGLAEGWDKQHSSRHDATVTFSGEVPPEGPQPEVEVEVEPSPASVVADVPAPVNVPTPVTPPDWDAAPVLPAAPVIDQDTAAPSKGWLPVAIVAALLAPIVLVGAYFLIPGPEQEPPVEHIVTGQLPDGQKLEPSKAPAEKGQPDGQSAAPKAVVEDPLAAEPAQNDPAAQGTAEPKPSGDEATAGETAEAKEASAEKPQKKDAGKAKAAARAARRAEQGSKKAPKQPSKPSSDDNAKPVAAKDSGAAAPKDAPPKADAKPADSSLKLLPPPPKKKSSE